MSSGVMLVVAFVVFALIVAGIGTLVSRSLAAQRKERQRVHELLMGLAQARFQKNLLQTISVPVPAGLAFRFAQETARTTRMRQRGKLVEQQVGIGGFDTQIYIECDDPRLAPWLVTDSRARELILSLVWADRGIQRKGRQLLLQGGNLPRGQELKSLALLLRELGDRLPVFHGEHPMLLAQRFRLRVVWAVASCVLVGAGLGGLQLLLEAMDNPFPQHVSLWPLLLKAGLVGVVTGGLLWYSALRWLRGSSQPPRLSSLLVMAAWIPLIVLSMLGSRLYNLRAATAPEQQEVSRIGALYTERSRKSVRYYFLLPALAGGRIEAQQYRSSKWLNERFKPGQRVRVYWREGALGVDFLSREPQAEQSSAVIATTPTS